ncbi:MAG: hypothetical protein P8074_25040 [Anaerolineales bacterium]
MHTTNASDPRIERNRMRRQVELLRQQLYWQPDLTQTPELLDRLLAAEGELHRLEQAIPEKDDPAVQGVLMDTSDSGSETMGGYSIWTVRLELRQSHIPTGIVHLFEADDYPLVSAQINFQGDELARLRVSCWVEGYSDLAVDTAELTLYQTSSEIKLLPVFRSPAIRRLHELTRATLHFQILDTVSQRELYRTFPIWLLPQSSAYLWIQDPISERRIDLAPYLAAWVTPNDPNVMQILRNAAELHPNQALCGYQGDVQDVARQVEAIFQAMKAQDIRYINSVLTFGAVPGVFQQRVRLPRESLKTRSANCLDGTLLMASLLEAASLNPGIVLVPGHAFLAWETQDGNGAWDYLETTMTGGYAFSQAVQAGRKQAVPWQNLGEQTGDVWRFRRLSLRDLRLGYGISPIA